ncbi:MAG TPA: DNA repair protein RecO [Gammaproteobacteria bacterium]|nr:DNA repair protein RecO [Gammaproteobacteria bacterium]
MATRRFSDQPGFVLHTRAWSETSLLVDIFSRNQGRLRLLAKGARRPKSGQRGLLLPFQPLLFGWSGRGEMPVLTAVESDLANRHTPLCGEARLCGYYLNELLLRLLVRHDAHEGLFVEYANTLRSLVVPKWSEDILRIFEKRLLEQVGYGMCLHAEMASNRPVESHLRYCYIIGTGPQLLVNSQHQQANSISGATLLALAAEHWCDAPQRRESKQLLRRVLQYYLDGKPLRSRKVVQAVYAHRGREAVCEQPFEEG